MLWSSETSIEDAKQGDTMELGRIWQVGAVEVSQSPFARLGRMEKEEEEGLEAGAKWVLNLDKEVPEPPAPLGPGLGRAIFKRGLGERMPRVRKWSKPDQKLFFCRGVGSLQRQL